MTKPSAAWNGNVEHMSLTRLRNAEDSLSHSKTRVQFVRHTDFFYRWPVLVVGHLCLASTLLAAWLIVFVYRLTCVSFGRGQFRVHLVDGAGKTACAVLALVIRKRRDDLFWHWILGLGTDDLVVTTGGTNPQTFELLNVLWGSKPLQARQMLPKSEVARGQ